MIPKRRHKVPKMSAEDKQRVLHELDAWCRRERHGRLTWSRLEEVSGFTRQALSGHQEIVERYGEAKAVNRPESIGRISRRKSTDQRVLDLEREVERLKGIINRYDERWATYARNAALVGFDLERLEAPMDPPVRGAVRVMRRVSQNERRNGRY